MAESKFFVCSDYNEWFCCNNFVQMKIYMSTNIASPLWGNQVYISDKRLKCGIAAKYCLVWKYEGNQY